MSGRTSLQKENWSTRRDCENCAKVDAIITLVWHKDTVTY